MCKRGELNQCREENERTGTLKHAYCTKNQSLPSFRSLVDLMILTVLFLIIVYNHHQLSIWELTLSPLPSTQLGSGS